MAIGGNTTAEIQVMTTEEGRIGNVQRWKTIQSLKGWLDLQAGEAKNTTFNAKIEESTHLFLADYEPLHPSINAESSRMAINEQIYAVLLIDDPMGMNDHYEIYLKYTGGQ